MAILNNRVALITGGGRGIGKAIALAFAQVGAKVVVTARTASELEAVMDEIRRTGGEALAVTAELADRKSVGHIIKQTREAFGPVEILVNNAGVGSSANPRPVVDFDDAFWDLTLEVNLTAPYLLCKAVLPDMLKRRWGRIINVSSINGKVASYHGAAYAASKHGLLGLTRTLALEVARNGTMDSLGKRFVWSDCSNWQRRLRQGFRQGRLWQRLRQIWSGQGQGNEGTLQQTGQRRGKAWTNFFSIIFAVVACYVCHTPLWDR